RFTDGRNIPDRLSELRTVNRTPSSPERIKLQCRISLSDNFFGLIIQTLLICAAAIPAIGIAAQLVMAAPAKQLIERLAHRLAHNTPARGFNRCQRRALKLPAVRIIVSDHLQRYRLYIKRAHADDK